MKKLFAILMSIMMIACFMPTMAFAAGETASVSDVTVSGETNKAIESKEVTITLAGGAQFAAMPADTDVKTWFTNRPDGLEAKVKEAVKANETSVTITISGTPTAESNAVMTIEIPAANLVGDTALTVTENANAKFTVKAKSSGSGGGGGSYRPTTPTQSKVDKAKAESKEAISKAASANKYDEAEQAEVKKIVDKANADIKNAKTEAEVKAIQEAAQAEIDKILTTEEKAQIAAAGNVEKKDFKVKSKAAKLNGKRAIRLTWTAPEGMKVDGYEIFRSTKKNSGYGTEPYFTTTKTSYTNNKELKSGNTYYYKVRAFVIINGEKVYTDFSLKAWRTLK